MADTKSKGNTSGPLRQHQEYARTGKMPANQIPVTPKKPGP